MRAAHALQLTVVASLAMAVVMIHSAGAGLGGDAPTLGQLLTSRHAIYAAVAVAVMLLAARIDVRRVIAWRGPANPIPWVLLVAWGLTALTLVPGVGKSVNGASRWLEVGPISFQPSELVKWTMVAAIAYWCARRGGVVHRFRPGLLPALLLVAVSCGLVVVEDLGTAALIGLVAVLLLLTAGARLWQVAMLVPPALAWLTYLIIRTPYRVARLTAFLDPWADPQGTGYHPIQSMLAIAQGGLTGRGLGNGIQKFGYLPEDTTDFIFAIVCEELGLAGAALVAGLVLVIVWACLSVARRCEDTFGRLFALGVMLTFGLQALINIAVVTVVVPTKGIALPLISAGGTGWVVTAFALGLVAGLDPRAELPDDASEQAPPAVRDDGPRLSVAGMEDR